MKLAQVRIIFCLLLSAALLGAALHPFGQTTQAQSKSDAPDLKELDNGQSELRNVIERYVADRGSMSRSYPSEVSPARMARFKQFYGDWLAMLGKLNFEQLSQDGKVDYLLLKNHLEHEAQQLELQRNAFAELAPLVPFAQTITDFAEARRSTTTRRGWRRSCGRCATANARTRTW